MLFKHLERLAKQRASVIELREQLGNVRNEKEHLEKEHLQERAREQRDESEQSPPSEAMGDDLQRCSAHEQVCEPEYHQANVVFEEDIKQVLVDVQTLVKERTSKIHTIPDWLK